MPRLLARLMTAAYPWLLAATLIVFVWQTVAARRAAVPLPPPDADASSLNCKTLSHAVLLGPIPEASGLALSARTPGILWSMNDSGTPAVFAIDVMGRVLSSVRITGADVNNWEDVSVGPCGNGSCLYVADTGNGGGTQRNDVVIYRVPEPAPTDSRSAPAETFNAAYPADEDHESEAVFVAGGQLYLVTKGHPSLVFRFPRRMDAGTLATLEDIGQVPTEQFQATTIRRQTRITDAETSPDGKWVAMRTNKALLLYRAADVIAGRLDKVWHLDLTPLDEPQGEGVAITNDGDVYLAGEGGGHGLPGTFAHLKCSLPAGGS
ncbi:MAG TPA: hypothetical protein VKC35_16950 [Vicinamibacterales bacterium]|nr:hypothetical protein [Vicinamibacterales bacterium]